MKGESPHLRDWIVYHHLCGIDHFYLYNNDKDQSLVNRSIFRYISLGLVTIIDFGEEMPPFQTKAYNHFVSAFREETQWAAFWDIDEFL